MERKVTDLNELPRFRDGLSYLYLEAGNIVQHDFAVVWLSEMGSSQLPAASLSVLMLGPGTSITHAAVHQLAQLGCSVLWVGQDLVRFYACGTGETRSSLRVQRQARAWCDQSLHLRVVRKMYALRFGYPVPEEWTLEQLRGHEGVRVRTTYTEWSRKTGVPWYGRRYDRNKGQWNSSDPVNRALSSGAACLYGVCHAAIVSAGYSTALGFLHTGKQLSFVYDVADIYKASSVIPVAFQAVADSPNHVESRVRTKLRDQFRETRLLERVIDDLNSLFPPNASEAVVPDGVDGDDPALPGDLWEGDVYIPGGTAYGLDHS